jgi:signal transduction histidine kinase
MLQKEDGTDYPLEELPMMQAMKEKRAVKKNDIRFVTKDGNKMSLQSTAVPVFDASKKLDFVVVVFEDITKEHEVDRMKTEFISLASHQLRTPLSAMRWYLEMLQDGDAGKLKPKQEEFIKSVSDSNLRLIALVNSLLNVSRIESGRIIIEPKETNLSELLKGVLAEVKVTMEKKKQKAIISVNPSFPTIVTDQSLLRNALMNLLTNAVKYTPEKGEITILASRKEEEIVIQISDTGYGIPKKEQKNVFTKFYRGSNILKKETDGNGLGMYLVKSVIDSLNGTITFESKVDEGTTFYIHLPIKGVKAKKGEVSLDS